AVIVLVIMRSRTGRTVVATTGGDGGLVECIDRRTRVGPERDVDLLDAIALGDPKIRLGRDAHAEHHAAAGVLRGDFSKDGVAERRERLLVERTTDGTFADRDACVIDHGTTIPLPHDNGVSVALTAPLHRFAARTRSNLHTRPSWRSNRR